jgi:hypothetical protein
VGKPQIIDTSLKKAGLERKIRHSTALHHSYDYLSSLFYPYVMTFQEEIVYLQTVLKRQFLVVFGDRDPPWNDAEHKRRFFDDEVPVLAIAGNIFTLSSHLMGKAT